MAFFDWHGGDFPFDKVFSHPSPFKLLLKTKDDPWFVRKWFEHHRAICGAENIVIFDNRSTDPIVLDFYREIAATTQIVRFRGHMDDLHDTDMQHGLYAALARSCRRFCFLDTDELLVCLADERNLMAGEDIVAHSPAFRDDGPDYWPGLWLHNAFKSEDSFHLGGKEFCNNLQWGKPILSTGNIPHGKINHNVQVAQLTDNVAATSPFVVLHARDLVPEQRIAAAMKKLEAYHYIDGKTRPEEVVSADLGRGLDGDPKAWVDEITHLLQVKDERSRAGSVRIEDGRIAFRDSMAETLFSNWYRNGNAAYTACGMGERAA